MATAKVTLSLWHNWGDFLQAVRKIEAEGDFSLVVLKGMNAIQKYQRQYAPKGRQKRVVRSIQTARITKRGNIVSAVSKSNYGPAIFTNEGTGSFKTWGSTSPNWSAKRRAYFIPQGSGGYWHPGIHGTHWWERGAERGSIIALAAFRRKVETMLTIRGKI